MIQNPSWWIFLVLVPLVYWLAPARFRPAILMIASFSVLALISPLSVAFMVALSLFVYFILKYTAPTPGIATIQGDPSVAATPYLPSKIGNVRMTTWMFFVVLGYLVWYKYTPQVADWLAPKSSLADIAVPVGISYFAFKLMHYALERGRGTLPAHNIQDFVSWMFLMPTFTSGPIERFDHFQANKETTFQFAFVVEGLTRITQGLVKRFILVDQLTQLCIYLASDDLISFAHGNAGQEGVWAVWAYLFVALVVLYLDFSAYTDIAIGASRMFGFKIMENFDYPLLATNITDFWKRWHMSLTGWCRAYVYMPLIGMTRNPYLAVIATFLLVGVWHAGTIHWVAWGLWHGCGQAGALLWQRFAQRRKFTFFKSRPGKIVGWAMTMAYVSLGGALVAFHGATAGNGTFWDSFVLMGRAFGINPYVPPAL